MYLNINRKQQYGMNSKDSPEWFKIIPEWKRTQFKEYLAKNFAFKAVNLLFESTPIPIGKN